MMTVLILLLLIPSEFFKQFQLLEKIFILNETKRLRRKICDNHYYLMDRSGDFDKYIIITAKLFLND